MCSSGAEGGGEGGRDPQSTVSLGRRRGPEVGRIVGGGGGGRDLRLVYTLLHFYDIPRVVLEHEGRLEGIYAGRAIAGPWRNCPS